MLRASLPFDHLHQTLMCFMTDDQSRTGAAPATSHTVEVAMEDLWTLDVRAWRPTPRDARALFECARARAFAGMQCTQADSNGLGLTC